MLHSVNLPLYSATLAEYGGMEPLRQELRTLDDAGRICDTVWDPEGGNFVRARSFHDPFRSLSYYYISQLEPPGDWLEITYPYGEPWSIRVDWEEVQP